jgi:hypothetical protein
MLRTARLSLFAILLLGLTASCDFGAAEDAVDQFEVLVGLPPLATVVNLQALDASSGTPINNDVQVTFEGAGASSVVDIYSDPLSTLTIQEGFANFALDSTRSPSVQSPVGVTLRAQAEGYDATSVSIKITQEGSISRVLRLRSENPEESAAGTSGRRSTANASENGETTSAVTAQTAPTSDGPDAAQASVSIPSGTRLQTASGEPLQGEVTMDLSVFDNSANAQELLPAEAKETENGRSQIRGAVQFQATDQGGRVASQYGTAGQDTSTISADLPGLGSSSGTPTVTFINPESGKTRSVDLSLSSTSRLGGATKHQQDETIFQIIGSDVIINSPSGRAQVDLSELGGEFFAAVGVDPSQSCTPQGTLTVNPNGQTGSVALRVSGDGFAVDTEVSIPSAQSSFEISASSLFEGEIPDVGPVDLTLRTSDEQEVTGSIDLCSGSTSITLPAQTTSRIDATLKVVPDCPEGQRLPVSPPFDGYSAAYRQEGSTDPYETVPKEDITINTTDDTFETVTSAIVPVSGVLPNTDYDVIGTFGSESSSQLVTMPGQDGGQVIVTDQELRDQCQ